MDAYENGEIVAVEPAYENNEFSELNDKLDGELQRIVDKKISEDEGKIIFETVCKFAALIKSYKNAELTLDAVCFAFGLYITEGETLTAMAARHGVTKQAVSKRVVDITNRLGIPPSRGMKSIEARESYKKAHTKIK